MGLSSNTHLDTMLQAVQLPAGIADLDSGLADVDGDTLTLGRDTVLIYSTPIAESDDNYVIAWLNAARLGVNGLIIFAHLIMLWLTLLLLCVSMSFIFLLF